MMYIFILADKMNTNYSHLIREGKKKNHDYN